MSELKIETKIDCFGTIDKKNKESCNHCANSGLCETFKPTLEQHITQAEEKGRTDYIYRKDVEVGRTKSKYIVYGFIVIVLLFLSVMLYQEI
ncbi:MAG: hypothetical protein KAG20_03670 [Cocleimonas sp.]|nr:hypothetical protein [Cocleimonas sp.]